MRTTLLRRLRRKANKEYYVRVSTILPDNTAYDIMRREPLAEERDGHNKAQFAVDVRELARHLVLAAGT